MLLDRFKKKQNKPSGSSSTESDIKDLTGEVPEIDGVLAELDRALRQAETLGSSIGSAMSGCGCGGSIFKR
jgi:hypothetical protein